MHCTCLWRDMKTNGRLRLPLRRRWANAERRVLVASTDGFQPYSRLTGTGMKQLHAWVCNPIAGGGCAVPCQSLEQEMAPEATKQVRCTVYFNVDRCRFPHLHIHIFMETCGRAGTRNGADKVSDPRQQTVGINGCSDDTISLFRPCSSIW